MTPDEAREAHKSRPGDTRDEWLDRWHSQPVCTCGDYLAQHHNEPPHPCAFSRDPGPLGCSCRAYLGHNPDAPGPEPLTDLLWYAGLPGSRGTGRTCHRLGATGDRRSLCGKSPPQRAGWVPVDDIPDVEFAPCLTCARGYGGREKP